MNSPQRTRRQRFVKVILIAALAGGLTFLARNDSSGDRSARFVSGLMQFQRIFRRPHNAPTELGKNHQLVKNAFRGIIADANESTVRVLIDGQQVALGTVVGPHGLVLTKLSELDGQLTVDIEAHGQFSARIQREWRELDLALIRIEDGPRLPAVSLEGADAEPRVGSWVAIPGGTSTTPLAVGVVSSPIRPVNSEMAMLGVYIEDAEAVRVNAVVEGSSADQCGITVGDVVTHVSGTRILNRRQLVRTIRGFDAGDTVDLHVRRKSGDRTSSISLRVTLGSSAMEEFAEEAHTGGRLNLRRSGFAEVIQHDCPLRANQCGGPLVDVHGRVIGINIAKAGRVEIYALPISMVRKHLGSLATVPRPLPKYATQLPALAAVMRGHS